MGCEQTAQPTGGASTELMEGAQAGGEGLHHSLLVEKGLDRLLESLLPAGRLISFLFFAPFSPASLFSLSQ